MRKMMDRKIFFYDIAFGNVLIEGSIHAAKWNYVKPLGSDHFVPLKRWFPAVFLFFIWPIVHLCSPLGAGAHTPFWDVTFEMTEPGTLWLGCCVPEMAGMAVRWHGCVGGTGCTCQESEGIGYISCLASCSLNASIVICLSHHPLWSIRSL